MKAVDIIENLLNCLATPAGRHLYGVLGSYKALGDFAGQLHKAKDAEGNRFRRPLSVTRGILEQIPDEEFKQLCDNEAKRPRPTAKHVEMAFDKLLRNQLKSNGLLVLNDLELLWPYEVNFGILRSLAADQFQVLLLLPGRRSGGRIVMFPEMPEGDYTLPTNLIANNHLWELSEA